MHWKLKATIQNTVSLLPSSTSYALYYWLQRHLGGLRRINPVSELSKGIETWKLIKALKYEPLDKVFLEVGTGRIALVPLSYWLMGARKTISIDLNPYLKGELIKESIQYISNHKNEIENLFGSLLDNKRWNTLLEFTKNANFSTEAYLNLCQIDYIAPSNAANTGLAPHSIDFHTSSKVFEHIPLEILKQIIKEGNRIINKNGLFIHDIDYSDHFSHSDTKISAINFLSYSDHEWERYAGNRYMYMNRLRHDDFLELFRHIGHNIVENIPKIDKRSQDLLKSGVLQLDERFKKKSEDILSISGSWIVSNKSST